MKKLIIAILAAGLISGCSIDHMTRAQTHVSSFDGSKSIKASPMYVFASTGKHAAPFFIGANWFDGLKKNVSVNVVVNYEYVEIASLELNFDGEIKKYNALTDVTDFKAPVPQIMAPRSSNRSFIMPISDIEKFKTAKSVKIRVGTRNGGLVGDVVKGGELSPGGKALINVADEVSKFN